MKRWYVQSGGLSAFVKAESVEEAAAQAVREAAEEADATNEPPPRLGELVQVVEVVPDAEVWWYDAKSACQRAGRWRGGKADGKT